MQQLPQSRPRNLDNDDAAPTYAMVGRKQWETAVRNGALIANPGDALQFFVDAVNRNEASAWKRRTNVDDGVTWTWPLESNPILSVKSDFPYASVAVTYNLHDPNVRDERGHIRVSNPDSDVFLAPPEVAALAIKATDSHAKIDAYHERVRIHQSEAAQRDAASKAQMNAVSPMIMEMAKAFAAAMAEGGRKKNDRRAVSE